MSGIAATILLARNGEPGNGGWIQLIVFVILGFIYVIGGLAKMKANKAADKEEQKDKPAERLKRQPRYKPLDDIAPPRHPEARRTAVPEVSRISPRPVRQIRRPTEMPARREHRYVARVPEAPRRPVGPTTKPTLPEIEKSIPSLEPLEPAVPLELAKIEKLGVDLSRGQKEEDMVLAGRPALNYQDPDALREAIVHYEILGKPLSLREPGQHIWEL
jgi:hypothetical protein